MKGRKLPFGSPEKRQNTPPAVSSLETARAGHDEATGIDRKDDSDSSSTPNQPDSNGAGDPSTPLSVSRPKRKASAGSFQEVPESLNGAGTPRLGSPEPQSLTPSNANGTPLMKDDNGDAQEGRGRSLSLDSPSLTAVQQDGSIAVVRIIVERKVYFPPRSLDRKKSLKTHLGHDGNQYHCQVCREFGDVVCCDGCPRVYHRKCIPMDDPSRKSVDNDPWYCPECFNKTDGGRPGKRSEKGDRKSSQHRCVDCGTRRSDVSLEPCIECGNYVHHPSCRDEDDGSNKVFCSTCRAVNALSREEMEAAGLNDIKSDDDDDDDDDEGDNSPQKKKRKKKQSKKKKKKRRLEEKERTRAMMEATGTTRTRVAGLPQATPAFYFYLGENRWKVERVLAKKHRTFNRLPKGDERNALVAQEAAVWWSKLRSADQKRYIQMSMKDYEGRILAWKDEKSTTEMGIVQDERDDATEEELKLQDERISQEYHNRLYTATTVESRAIHPKSGQSYNRLLLELLHDSRFHPNPMLSPGDVKDGPSDVEGLTAASVPHFDVHGPVSTGVGDECLGCTRGWSHYCTVLKRQIPAIEYRAKLQPPVSSLAATRIGLGLRLPLEHDAAHDAEPGEEDKSHNEEKEASDMLFEWRDSTERDMIKRLSVLPSSSLLDPSDRSDDVVNFVEEVLYMKVPGEGGRMKKSENGSARVFKCGQCRSIIDNGSGCVPCRRAQLIVNLSKRQGSLKGKDKEDDRMLKVHTTMLGRVQSRGERPAVKESLIANAILKEKWSPSTILPATSASAPVRQRRQADTVHDNVKQVDILSCTPENDVDSGVVQETGSVESIDDKLEGKSTLSESNEDRQVRSLRKQSIPAYVDFGDPAERQKVQEQRKREIDALLKKSVHVACGGILLALTRRDPMGIFTDPVDIEGYLNVVKRPMDVCTIRENLGSGKYTSLGGFVADAKVMYENAILYNAEGSVHHNTAKDLLLVLQDAQRRAGKWINAVKESHTLSFVKADDLQRLEAARKDSDRKGSAPQNDPFADLRKVWPDAMHMLEQEEWIQSQIELDFCRSSENETAYYGALAVKRIAIAAESALAPYPDSDGMFGVVSKRHHSADEALRNQIDDRVSSIVYPGQLTDATSAKEDAVAHALRKIQSCRVESRLISESGCSRCDSVLFDTGRKMLMNAEGFWLSKNRRVDIHNTRTNIARSDLTTGLASTNAREKQSEATSESDDCVSIRASRIQGVGVFADRQFHEGDIVAEYLGEYMSASVADKRELKYIEERRQAFMFRFENGDALDATMKGSHARYMNHSCTPNCSAKITPAESESECPHRVLLIATEAIDANDEITYDYQYPLEFNFAKRLPCNCRSTLCRGFMNWDLPETEKGSRSIIASARPASIRDRIRKLGKPSK